MSTNRTSPFESSVADQKGVVTDASAQLLNVARKRIQSGAAKNAKDALRQLPELLGFKSVVLELAIDEYQRERSRNREVDIEGLCEQFPRFHSSIRRQLEVEELLAGNSLSSAFTDAPPDWPAIGDRLSDFLLTDELGQGRFARVYRAQQLSLANRIVAVKVTSDVAQEAASLGALNHANIVRVHGVYHVPEHGLSCICMEYAGCLTMLDLLDAMSLPAKLGCDNSLIRNSLQESKGANPRLASATLAWPKTYQDTIAWFGERLADALDHAHRANVLHLDIKPSNVLISFDGQPKLLDFNLSALANAPPRRLGGTLPYMAPELVSALADTESNPPSIAVCAANDIYSLGALLYELLTGRLPFTPAGNASRGSLQEAARSYVALQQRPNISGRWQACECDRDLMSIVDRCLSLEPSARFQSAAELACALRSYLSTSRRVSRSLRYHRRLVLSGVGVFLLGAALASWRLATQEPLADRHYSRGLALVQHGDYPEARREFSLAIDAARDEPELRYARAVAMQKSGLVEDAIRDLDDAIQKSPQAKFYTLRGYCFQMLARPEPAERDYSIARHLGDDSRELRNNLGVIYTTLKNESRAIEEFDDVVLSYPDWPTVRFNRGISQFNLDCHRQSLPTSGLDDLRIVVAHAPQDRMAHFYIAASYAILSQQDPSQLELAFSHLGTALKNGLDPSSIQVQPAFDSLHDDPRFKALCFEQRTVSAGPELEQIVEPIPVFRFSLPRKSLGSGH